MVTFLAVDSLHLSDHDSEPEHEIDPLPSPVADPNSDYKPAVDIWSPSPPSPVHGQPSRGQLRGQARGLPGGEGEGHAPAQPCMPPVLNCACVLYNFSMLLTHVRGAISFEALCTVNGVAHPTFQSACLALGPW